MRVHTRNDKACYHTSYAPKAQSDYETCFPLPLFSLFIRIDLVKSERQTAESEIRLRAGHNFFPHEVCCHDEEVESGERV